VTAVAHVYRHERYQHWSKGPDLCLLRLRDAVTGIATVQLADSATTATRYVGSDGVSWRGGDAQASGWGRTCNDCPTSPVLLEAAVQLLTPQDCQAWYSIANETMLCGLAPGRDAAPGDSGGGLYQTLPDGRIVLAGVVSFGGGCDTEQTCVGAYAAVPPEADGIRTCIGGAL
jgi:secreted trypsin-like serine protease